MGMGATTLPPTWGHVTRYPFTSSFMRRGTVNWSQMKLTFSPWWVLLIDKSWRSPSILGSGLGDCLSGHYFLVMCVFRAPDTHASPLLFLIITDVSLITWGARMLLPLGWASGLVGWSWDWYSVATSWWLAAASWLSWPWWRCNPLTQTNLQSWFLTTNMLCVSDTHTAPNNFDHPAGISLLWLHSRHITLCSHICHLTMCAMVIVPARNNNIATVCSSRPAILFKTTHHLGSRSQMVFRSLILLSI